SALAALRDQYDLGVEPNAVLRGLLESVHAITRAKVGGAEDAAQSAEEREACAEWASRLSYAAVHRLWQLLLKGLAEVHNAPMPLEAAEMALLRVIHASELPDPGTLLEKLSSGEAVPSARSPAAAPAGAAEGTMLSAPPSFEAFTELIETRGKAILAHQLRENYRLVDYGPPSLLLQQTGNVREVRDIEAFIRTLRDATDAIFGQKWQVALSDGPAQPTLREQEQAAEAELKRKVLETPLVKAALEAFPGAELARYNLDEQRSA
ncbi:MAG TPA: DNA polymerase III subunit gamma/tau, partial [Allosphingosinicella sp.]|nr:DNA polymerase III subunit gamma/tau [Allosphingosinicella sp.]